MPPDREDGNEQIAKEVIMAHLILENVDSRIKYHNEFNYTSRSWYNPKKYWSFIRPEVLSEDGKITKTTNWSRVGMIVGSILAAGVGFGIIVATGGLATVPMIVGET